MCQLAAHLMYYMIVKGSIRSEALLEWGILFVNAVVLRCFEVPASILSDIIIYDRIVADKPDSISLSFKVNSLLPFLWK